MFQMVKHIKDRFNLEMSQARDVLCNISSPGADGTICEVTDSAHDHTGWVLVWT